MQNTIAVLFAAAALASGLFHTSSAAILPRPSIDNSLDNEITINNPTPNNQHRYFLDITSAPAPARHSAGAITELQCQAMGSPVPTIIWLKNGQPVIEDELETNEIITPSAKVMATINSTLQIVGASPNREDEYTCVARSPLRSEAASTTVYNDLDSMPTIYARVSALNRELASAPRRARVTQHATTVMPYVGNLVTLPCRAAGNPAPRVSWERRSGALKLDGRVRVLESGDLLISSARWSDMDVYTCTATNHFGKDSAATFFYPLIDEPSKHLRHIN